MYYYLVHDEWLGIVMVREILSPLPESTAIQAYASPIVKKKRSHDLAYLLIILAALFGTFLFVMVLVNSLLQTIP